MIQKLSITIASVPDRKEVVAELWYGKQQWGEISQEEGRFKLEIYRHPTEQLWTFDLKEILAQISEAKKKLLGIQFED